jgi:hypothetical protein
MVGSYTSAVGRSLKVGGDISEGLAARAAGKFEEKQYEHAARASCAGSAQPRRQGRSRSAFRTVRGRVDARGRGTASFL